ncbi:hypothetical protein KIL84_004420, partial [Mauremys mutica]
MFWVPRAAGREVNHCGAGGRTEEDPAGDSYPVPGSAASLGWGGQDFPFPCMAYGLAHTHPQISPPAARSSANSSLPPTSYTHCSSAAGGGIIVQEAAPPI